MLSTFNFKMMKLLTCRHIGTFEEGPEVSVILM
jgi:hypothetical protein